MATRLFLLGSVAWGILGGVGLAAPASVTLKNIRHEYQGPDNCAPVRGHLRAGTADYSSNPDHNSICSR